MKILIIYKSYHKRNTEKIAKAIAETMNAKLARVEDIKPEELLNYDVIGFGSGIYASKFHKKIYKFIEKMSCENRPVFTFCTSGSGEIEKKHLISEKLSEKGCKVIGEFSCPGEFSPFGFNLDKKGHPNEKDMENARIFAKDILKLQKHD